MRLLSSIATKAREVVSTVTAAVTGTPSRESLYRDALAFVLRWEGGYVNHPNDPGGATNKGITQETYNRYRRSNGLSIRSVRRIKQFEVEDIYRDRYWEAGHCDTMPNLVAFCHFDWTVNTGRGRSIKHLQQVVGTTADGAWGPKSKAACPKR